MSKPWNTCRECKQEVDCDDVHDGSEVRCLGCGRRFVVVEFEGPVFGLDPIEQPDEARKAGA